ncbi:MAG TPA: YggT family protein [Clostridiaceae bacterium]|jgi:YggT family protein|nr:YggT family protein [Clostridiaceae bacterium]
MTIATIKMAVSLLFNFIEAAILIEVVLSWIMPGKKNTFTDMLHIFTDPFLIPGKKIQSMIAPNLMIDFSPIIALIIVDIVERIILTIL